MGPLAKEASVVGDTDVVDDNGGRLEECISKLVASGFEEACAALDKSIEDSSELAVAELTRLTVVNGYVGAAGAVECETSPDDVDGAPE